MKILLIAPGIDNRHSWCITEANKLRNITPLLGLPYLAALTSEAHQVSIVDEENGLVNDLIQADLVGITGMTMHANRMYRLADMYRQKDVPVVLGGIHVSYMPDEASEHADSVVIGEADELWPEIIRDAETGRLKPLYTCLKPPSIQRMPLPRLDLVAGPAYHPPAGYLNSVMATRGCPHNCAFCCVTRMFGHAFRTRPVQDVADEISRMSDDPVFFNDDNLIGKPQYAEQLFQAIKPLNRIWGAQVSIRIAENEKLLKLAAQSGCYSLFIGIESIEPANILSINKKYVNNICFYEEAINRIHDYGISIIGSFIIGFDGDDESTFDRLYSFIEKNKIDKPIVGVLTPFPGTLIYHQLEESDRIIDHNWDKYNLANVVFRPVKLTAEKLQEQYTSLLASLNRLSFRRLNERMSRSCVYSLR